MWHYKYLKIASKFFGRLLDRPYTALLTYLTSRTTNQILLINFLLGIAVSMLVLALSGSEWTTLLALGLFGAWFNLFGGAQWRTYVALMLGSVLTVIIYFLIF